MFRKWMIVWGITLFIGFCLVTNPEKPQATARAVPAVAVPARAVPAKPIDPAVEAQRQRENEEKWQHVRQNPGSFCKTFESELREFTGIKSPCLK